ncbi:MAG: hypothetical protein D5R99_03705 [Methanocalculus sp. MSAO_Arc1]|uniref:hypothetical protein n=1 Tax=Methanocalculus TaxID=71151 RepID=UPI000FF351D4|nr:MULTISPECIES: hypothetical protein [unclassified Methanocalculus]MCP1661548.1 hypothetical protein [Methanocalculus sp. AMF5]RQD80902.1 MAG: hypothetical protein D5R99_03705 [Methanocalculus sp. MSAO_Arc1]
MAYATCAYCGRTVVAAGADPQGSSMAGSQRGRKLPVCYDCKRSKKDRSLNMWLRMLKRKDRMRWERIYKYHSRKTGGEITLEVKRVANERMS